MKLATMMAALVAAVACVASNAFVMPSAPIGAAARAGNALAPATSQPESSRSNGEIPSTSLGGLCIVLIFFLCFPSLLPSFFVLLVGKRCACLVAACGSLSLFAREVVVVQCRWCGPSCNDDVAVKAQPPCSCVWVCVYCCRSRYPVVPSCWFVSRYCCCCSRLVCVTIDQIRCF